MGHAIYKVSNKFREWWRTKINESKVHVDEASFPRMFAWEAWDLKEKKTVSALQC